MNLNTLLAAAIAFAALPAAADTLTFQHGVNGYAGARDTTLMSADADAVHGNDDFASIDASDGGSPNHVLLAFDNLFGNAAGQIKATDTIVSAKITFVIDSAGSGLLAHDMLQAWNEASITWNSAVNGIQADGVEAAATAFATLGANGGSASVFGDTFELDVTASLQAQQAGTLPGYGWALLPWMPSGTNGLDFITKEGFVVANRPLLTVQVSAVPEAGTLAMLAAGLGVVGALRLRRRA